MNKVSRVHAEELPIFYRASSGAYILACLPYYKLVPGSTILYTWICFTSYMNDQKHLFCDTSIWRYVDRISASLGMLNLVAQFVLYGRKVAWSRRCYFFFCVLMKLTFFRLSRYSWECGNTKAFFKWHACWHYTALMFNPCIGWIYSSPSGCVQSYHALSRWLSPLKQPVTLGQ